MRFAFALISGTVLAGPAAAAGWQFTATPYFMAPTMDGKAAVGPLDARVSVSPSEIFSNLNWGVMGIAELNNGQWGVNVDITYMNLDVTDDRARASINGHQGAYSGTLLYRVHEFAEVYGGARVNDIGAQLDVTLPSGIVRSAARSKTWVDPIVGVRAVLPFSARTDLTVLADAGGFGVASDIAVQFWPSLGFKVGGRGKAMLGYRLVYTKYESGTGNDRFVYDVLTFGPTAGFQFRF